MPDKGGKTWGDAIELWTSARERSDQELLSLAKFGRAFLDRALSAVTADDIETALVFVVEPSTFMRYRAMILSILNMAAKKGWLEKVPAIPTRKARKKKSKPWITAEQWETLKLELPPHMRVMATFAIETGLRQSNVLKLRWAQVNIRRKLVWIEADEMKGDEAHNVPLSDAALDVLKGQLGQHAEFVFTYERKVAGKLVRAPIGEVKTAFIKACVRAKLGTMTIEDGHSRYEGFTWHGFRHTWATWHIQNGTPEGVLQKLGGWADLKMVKVYAHHSPGHLASFANNNRRASL